MKSFIVVLTVFMLYSGAAWADRADKELALTGDCPRCDLSGKKLEKANLAGADLSRAVFRKAKLKKANLAGCNLTGADLRQSDLSHADLSGADLFGANLSGAKIKKTNFTNARLAGAIWVDGIPCSASAAPGQCR